MRRPKSLPAHIHWPTDEENAAIQRGIEADPDNPERTAEDFARARPATEVAPDLVAAFRRSRGRPAGQTKEAVSIRLDKDVLEKLRADGPGWQSKANALLRKAVLG